MKEAVTLLRRQSVILVDVFAAVFLFIFIAFLAIFIGHLASGEAVENPSSGGYKLLSGDPFSIDEIIDGMAFRHEHGEDIDFVELYKDKIIVSSRSYSAPRVIPVKSPTQAIGVAEDFFKTVEKDFDRLGPSIFGYPDGPHKDHPKVYLYIFHNNLYYPVRDEIQRRGWRWAEFIVPNKPTDPVPDESALEDGQEGARPSQAADTPLEPKADSTRWDDILDRVRKEQTRAQQNQSRPPMGLPKPPPLTDEEIVDVLIPLEEEEETQSRRNLVLTLLIAISAILALELAPVVSRRLSAAALSRGKTSS